MFTLVSALILVAVSAASVFTNLFTKAAASGIADSVIVELKDDPAAVWKAKTEKAGGSVSDEQLQNYRNSVKAKQDQFLAALEAQGIGYEIDGVDIPNYDGTPAGRADFRFNLVYNGITLKVPSAAIAAIKNMPQVKSVQNNDNLRVLLDKSVPYLNAPANYGQVAELTAFDDHREGFEGQGINIAVLDTGIDWSHAMFGGDPTPPRLGILPPTAATNSNKKVIYYLSFSGGLIDDFGHGTHASADAAGYLGLAPGADGIPNTTDDRRLHGIAPQARLMGYKVCTASGSCVNASTILAIEDSVSPVILTLQPKPVAHVINLSLGGVGGPDSASSVAASNAALLGTTVVASAGNSGPGEGTIGAPAAGRHVIAVGATTHPGAANSNWSVDVLKASSVPTTRTTTVTPASGLPTEDGFGRIKLFPMAGTPNPAAGSIAQRYVMVNNPLLTYPAAVTGRIALVKNAGAISATFADRCNRAAIAGASAMILISTTTNPTAVKSTIPCAIVSPADGEILVDALSSTDNNLVDPPNGSISELPIRVNPFLTNEFVGETAGFSSRGPVLGLGQVKPDVTAPGVAIHSATSIVGAPVASMMDPSRYISANGTSFSGPQVAGAVAIVKQAHLNYSPDMIRAALINTATNLRTGTGVPKADNAADAVNEQGGGLIDIKAAVDAKAIMGVAGDGIETPGILGSHSFGEAAILNNRITNTRQVTVTVRDTSGQGGTYNLSTVNNRETNRDGVTTSVSPASVTVPAGGSATLTATITIDGNVVRDTAIKQFQWYVVAARSESGEKLRMPLYLQATASLPSDQIASSETTTYTGTVLAGDAGTQRDNDVYVAENATYVDVPFEVAPSGLKIDATLDWSMSEVPEAGFALPDLDFLLFDPNGNEIGSSGNGTGPERIAVNTTIPGTYVYRAYGWANGPTDFTIESTILSGGAAPVVQPFAADFSSGAQRIDFDGNYNLTWQSRGSVEAYEIEESTDGANFAVVRTVGGSTTSAAFSNVADGTRSYRIRSITPGRIGKFVTLPSNVESITVSRRAEVDATGQINAVNRSIVFAGGTTELVTALKNQSSTVFFPNIRFEIVSVESTGNSVTVANADNGGNGTTTPAVFDYSQLVGADFVANEESGNKTIRFNNPNIVLFSFTARVKAHVLSGTGSTTETSTQSTTSDGSTGETSSTGDGTTSSGGTILGNSATLLKFTVNPLTGIVTTQLIQ
ncbi:MAG TPA: S8 family serine peptidase [Pyrinomonadaceae bacterium]|nr:S8 family serine peptidase [Pyrinomonadaceae bacterium]